MARSHDIDHLLKGWDYVPGEIHAREVTARDGRKVIQVRVDLGVLQLETSGRPDGTRPAGSDSYYDHLVGILFHEGADYELTEEQMGEVDREFLQYYQRRICWLALRQFQKAVDDANHNLALLDLISRCAPDDEWLSTHEQYRPFILFHRTQAAALHQLEDGKGPEKAIEALNEGLKTIKDVFAEHDADELYDENEMVQRLIQMRDALREQFDVGMTLEEQLAQAVAQEDYERAAKLRDQIAKRNASLR